MIQAELNAEVERSKSLLSNKNPPPSVLKGAIKRGAMSDVSDPKMSAVFTLYEDVTNLLVLKVRLEKAEYSGFDEKHFDCIYSAPSTPAELGNSECCVLKMVLRVLTGHCRSSLQLAMFLRDAT